MKNLFLILLVTALSMSLNGSEGWAQEVQNKYGLAKLDAHAKALLKSVKGNALHKINTATNQNKLDQLTENYSISFNEEGILSVNVLVKTKDSHSEIVAMMVSKF